MKILKAGSAVLWMVMCSLSFFASSFLHAEEKTYALKSSLPNTISGWATEDALEQVFAIKVQRLASHEVWLATFTSFNDPVTAADGTLDVEVRKEKFSIPLSAGATFRQLVDAMSEKLTGLQITVYDTFDGSVRPLRLVITDKRRGKHSNVPGAGKDSNIVFKSTLTEFLNANFRMTVEGLNSAIFMNGEMIYRSDNVISDLVPGVVFKLNAEDPTHLAILRVVHDSSTACGR
ncbi:MAG: hypothetical protein J0L93_11420 [Deltaproteobacteria bacterium]|nr:hypothetical protein [Deltaproteobacteria bacterium]